MSDPLNETEDWMKPASWDLDCNGEPVKTVRQLLYALGLLDVPLADQHAGVREFMLLPAWVPAPAALKALTLAWLHEPPKP